MIALAAALLMGTPAATPKGGFDTARLVGIWTCQGRFVKSGRPLAATVDIRPGGAEGTLIVDHRDTPPGGYHAIELWSLRPSGMRAAIADASGMRWFDGKTEADTIMLSRETDGTVIEQFAYRLSADTLTVDWSHRGADGALALGDTLQCKR